MPPGTEDRTAPRRGLPLSTALVSFAVLWGLDTLAGPPWPGIGYGSADRALLALALVAPLLALAAPAPRRGPEGWAAIACASLGAAFACLHAGLSGPVSADVDGGAAPSPFTAAAAAGVFLSALAAPAGLLLAGGLRREHAVTYALAPAILGALGQLAWFGILRLVQGPGGIEFWLWTRVLIHASAGFCAGVVAGGARLFLPEATPLLGRSPLGAARAHAAPAVGAAILLLAGATGLARIAAVRADSSRLVLERMDDYLLSLSNLRRAEREGLAYPGLGEDLDRARRTLIGAGSFDPDLPALIAGATRALEPREAGEESRRRFERAVLDLDRRLLAIGEPFFVAPHDLSSTEAAIRILMRYSVVGRSRYDVGEAGSVPVLRLGRIDRLLVDTPFTGISYPGMGTVLVDHVGDVALASYAPLFAPGATDPRREDGRFRMTRHWIAADRRSALEDAFSRSGAAPAGSLERLAETGLEWRLRADPHLAREGMEPDVAAAYDALVEILALQTEVHEARHAHDGDAIASLPELEALQAGPLGPSAAAEIRAHLTEIVDGPLGPRFGLAKVCRLLAGRDARANAYFFAALVILEGMWGEEVRRPDTVEREGPDGPVARILPITRASPGWLSYSRIHTCYADLRSLDPEDLGDRAAGLFERLFSEPYSHISRRGDPGR